MPNPPTTYDEITRRTVPEPDTSWRPTKEQEREAFQGHREMDAETGDEGFSGCDSHLNALPFPCSPAGCSRS